MESTLCAGLKYGLVGDHKYTFWSNFEFTLMKQ